MSFCPIFDYFYLNCKHIAGLASVLVRQTNIVWVGMALGMTVIDKFVLQTLPFIKDADKTGKVDHLYTIQVKRSNRVEHPIGNADLTFQNFRTSLPWLDFT